MSNQDIRETGSPDTPAGILIPSTATPPEPQRPVVIVRPTNGAQATDAADKAPKGTSRKPTSKKPANKKIRKRSAQGSEVSSGKKGNKQAERKSHFSRKQIIIGLIVIVLIFDVVILTVGLVGGNTGPKVRPNSDPIALIQGQMSNNRAIAEIGHDSALTFANYPDLTIVNAASLKPIENNLLKSGGGPDGSDSLYDEQIVGRVLKFNSDWVDYLNKSSQAVFESVQENSPAQTKATELGAGSLVAFHRLAIGEIRHAGKNYYLIARASYTLTKDGKLDIHDDVFVYKLVAQGNTMLIADFEQIPVNAAPEQTPEQTPEETPEETPAGSEPTEPDTEGVDEAGEGSTEEPAGNEGDTGDAADGGTEEGTEGSTPEPEG
jgi:hypothetical protein